MEIYRFYIQVVYKKERDKKTAVKLKGGLHYTKNRARQLCEQYNLKI